MDRPWNPATGRKSGRPWLLRLAWPLALSAVMLMPLAGCQIVIGVLQIFQGFPKDDADLKKQLQKLEKNGYAPGKTVISYCHVGLGRGSFQYLALRRAGHQNVKVYVGSWDEWGNDASLPLAAQP